MWFEIRDNALVLALAVAATLAFACDDGRDLIDPAQPAAVTAGAGCAQPPDAGPDCTCPDGGEVVVLPGCGKLCGLE